MITDHLIAKELVRGKALGTHAGVAPARGGWAVLTAIGQVVSEVLSALDDRNPVIALRVLEPARAQEEGSACARCITRGE